jgi:hypothetical protein
MKMSRDKKTIRMMAKGRSIGLSFSGPRKEAEKISIR